MSISYKTIVISLAAALTLSSLAGAQTDPLTLSFPAHEAAAMNGHEDVAGAQPDQLIISFPTKEAAAMNGLEDVHSLRAATAQDADLYAKALGFTSAEEAHRAQLGIPLPIHIARLAWLKIFSSQSEPQNFIVATDSLIYPLLIDGKVKSSLTVTKDRETNRWRTTEWGSPKLITLLERLRRPQSSILLLISPQNPLGLRFLGETVAGELLLVPITNIPKLKLEAGQQQSARQIFVKLRHVANQYKGSQLDGLKDQTIKP